MCILFWAARRARGYGSWSPRRTGDSASALSSPSWASGSSRVSNSEREDVAEQLRVHATDGRLSFDELDQRLGDCLSATTYDELHQVLVDLPSIRAPHRAESPRWSRAIVPGLILVAFVTIAVGVLLTGHAFPFLPLVPLGVFAVLVVSRASLWPSSPPSSTFR